MILFNQAGHARGGAKLSVVTPASYLGPNVCDACPCPSNSPIGKLTPGFSSAGSEVLHMGVENAK